MNKSESINELATALSKFQGEIKDCEKIKQGYGYKYVELSSILEEARPLLCKHGLSVTQLCCEVTGVECMGLETVLMHSSGQWISQVMSFELIPINKMNKHQTTGTAISYMRRYSLAALLGISYVDEDGTEQIEEPKKKINL